MIKVLYVGDALNSDPDIEVKHLTNWDAYRNFPKSPDDFTEYDVVFLSDVESEVLLLYPEWTQAPMRPNRLKSLRDYVYNGGSFGMIGGWSSFSGRFGTAAYQGTPVEEAASGQLHPCRRRQGGDAGRHVDRGTRRQSSYDEGHPVGLLQAVPCTDSQMDGGKITCPTGR